MTQAYITIRLDSVGVIFDIKARADQELCSNINTTGSVHYSEILDSLVWFNIAQLNLAWLSNNLHIHEVGKYSI